MKFQVDRYIVLSVQKGLSFESALKYNKYRFL